MKKLFAWLSDRWLSVAALVLLAFIPLYPKLPLVDIKNTWVYIRVEDFFVLFVLLGWVVEFVRNKVTIKTPLTVPILLFWVAGGVATLHSILLIVPVVWEIYPNVALLSYLRRIEYMSVFFIAFSAVRDHRYFSIFMTTLAAIVFGVSIYGIGQKYLGFPAYLTMNEEFAKGVPLTLSALGRVSSTFGGHYDLAAYLVLTLPILLSLALGVVGWAKKIILAAISLVGLWVLVMTVSRISVFAVLLSFGLVLLFQNKKFVLLFLPVVLVGSIVLFARMPQLLDRFTSTVKEVDVIIDAKSGRPVGHVKEVPQDYFKDITVRQYFYDSISDVATGASPSAKFIVPYSVLGEKVTLLTEPTAPTGEDLPSGTGYINLTLSPDVKRLGNFLYAPKPNAATTSAEAFVINGEYLVKRAYAYDLSFTTRFQGEWPKAIIAFKRNVLVGSGYGSVSLAVDNSYLRMLGEVGLAGFLTFASVFIMMALFIVRTLPKIESMPVRSFLWGYMAGFAGLCVNALFIDVFEASKVAFTLWLLTGTAAGIVATYSRAKLDYFVELKRIASSKGAVVVYIFVTAFLLYSPLSRTFFIGDDFTWFRWAAESLPNMQTIGRYFVDASGFFYRPGTKIYFTLLYRIFWLDPSIYHTVSIILHGAVGVAVYLLALRVLNKKFLAALSAIVFISLSGFTEAVFWISAVGFLWTTLFTLLSILFYASWREHKHIGYFVGTFTSLTLSLLFHELGVIAILLILLYEWTIEHEPMPFVNMWRDRIYRWLFLPIPIYAILRYFAQSHGLSGDYNFNLVKFPLNAVGNLFGYLLMAMGGANTAPLYMSLRTLMRDHMGLAFVFVIVGVSLLIYVVRTTKLHVENETRRRMIFSALFFVIALLPFLGLGNIAPRYGYLASVGMILFGVFVLDALYTSLLRSGKEIAQFAIGSIIIVFLTYQSVSLYQAHKDWHEAGEKVRKFFVSMDYYYHDYWSETPMEFHFVDVPIRHREAWVFPVGLSDALWFVFQNSNITVTTWPSKDKALERVTYGDIRQKVFVFGPEGNVQSVDKPQPIIP